jgi:hypothetical protein
MTISRTQWSQHIDKQKAAWSLIRATQLKMVVCNTNSPDAPTVLPETNCKCDSCGRGIWCDPIFSGATVRVCLLCDPYITELN